MQPSKAQRDRIEYSDEHTCLCYFMQPHDLPMWIVSEVRIMRFVALGDSITYGDGASRPCRSYPNVLTALLRRGEHRAPTYGDILAQPGWTSGALRAAVTASNIEILRSANAVIVWIGGDDLADTALRLAQGAPNPQKQMAGAIKNYAFQLGGILTVIRTVSKANVYVCTQYNPFPNSPLAVAGIQTLNTTTLNVANRAGCHCVDTSSWFAGRESALIAGYRTGTLRDARQYPIPIHPNDRGHLVIAEGLYRNIAPNIRS